MNHAQLIIEKLNFELTTRGNYPTNTVTELLTKLSEIVWDTDDQEITDTYYQYIETFDLIGQFH